MPAEGIFDTHAHLYDGRYPEEGISPEDVLFRAAEAGVTRILIPADNEESSLAAMEYVRDHDGTCGVALYCSVGVHPHEASSYNGRVEEKLISWLGKKTENKIMAWERSDWTTTTTFLRGMSSGRSSPGRSP